MEVRRGRHKQEMEEESRRRRWRQKEKQRKPDRAVKASETSDRTISCWFTLICEL